MAVIVRLETEMPPVVIPPYSLGTDSSVREVLEAACAFYRQDPSRAKLWDAVSGAEIPVDDRKLREHGLGDWSLLTLGLSSRPYRRGSFG